MNIIIQITLWTSIGIFLIFFVFPMVHNKIKYHTAARMLEKLAKDQKDEETKKSLLEIAEGCRGLARRVKLGGKTEEE